MPLCSYGVAGPLLLFVATASAANERLPSALIRIPELTSTVFVAETSTAKFHRFDRSGSGLTHHSSYSMSIGQRGAGKEASGDKRTPIGVYFVTEQLDTSKLHEKYGVTAFPLDYPNAWDERAQRSGDGIWVHGVHPGGGPRPALDTDGCIALSNEDLSALAGNFKDHVTLVLVAEEIVWVDKERHDDVAVELEGRIQEWVDSQVRGDAYAYLSLYDEEFSRWGINRSEWSALALDVVSESANSATFSDLLLVAYPDEDALFVSRFLFSVERKGKQLLTTTRLYWRRNADGELTIIAEDAG